MYFQSFIEAHCSYVNYYENSSSNSAIMYFSNLMFTYMNERVGDVKAISLYLK